MSQHVIAAALHRYGLVIDATDVESIAQQCRSGRHLLRRVSDDGAGRPSEHHQVVVHGKRVVAVFKRGHVVTILPPDWLVHDNETAIAAAFRRALNVSHTTPHTGD